MRAIIYVFATFSYLITGELRKDTSNELVHVAVATESVGLKDDDYAAVQVLEQILGGYPRIRYSNGATNAKLAKAVALAIKAPFAVIWLY